MVQSLEVLFTGPRTVEVREMPVSDTPLEPDAVLVRAQRSLVSTGTECICYARLFEPQTHWDNWVQYPFRPGYCLFGCIEAVGEHVKDFHPGDRVAVSEAHRQYVRTSASRLHSVPDTVSDDEAPWFALANITQIGVRRAAPGLGEAVIVVGAGLLGQLAIQYSRLLGAREVIVIDPAEMRINMAQRHGATASFACRVQDAAAQVLALTEGQGAEIVYDITGVADVFAQTLPLVRRFGRLILLGDTGFPSAQHLTPDVIRRGLKVIGAHALHAPDESTDFAYWSPQRMTSLFYTYLTRGDMTVSDLITHRFSPYDAPYVYDMLQKDRHHVMGVLFDWSTLD